MNNFEYFAPKTIREAVALVKAHPKGRVLAGGTDMLVRMKARGWEPDVLIDVKRISGMDELKFSRKAGLSIGAGVTMRQIELSEVAHTYFPGLAQGASLVGSFQIRNLATVVGNICNAAPSADTAPGLITLGAKVRIAGPGGRRSMLVENIILGPGKTALKPGEFVTGIQVPMTGNRTGSAYVRHTPRGAMDIAMVGVGAAVTLAPRTGICEDVKIVMGAVAPVPLRAKAAERLLKGEAPSDDLFEAAGKIAARESRPISDVRGSAEFRRQMVGVLTTRMVSDAVENARKRSGSKRRAA